MGFVSKLCLGSDIYDQFDLISHIPILMLFNFEFLAHNEYFSVVF